MLNGNRVKYILFLILFFAFLVRLIPINSPFFAADEARIAYRGYTIATSAKDELNRFLPIIFNSSLDYQLPIVSYLTTIGVLIFGKSEFGVRLPFILIGTLLVLLTYHIAKFFNFRIPFCFLSAAVVAFSPPLIFLSKIPNETIVLTFVLMLLFYLLIKNKNPVLISAVMILSLLVSKFAWFILLPFVLLALAFTKQTLKQKTKLVSIALIVTLVTFVLFYNIDQSQRSLMENNFSLFTDITIKNGIDKLRGQGIDSGWPNLVDKILFNKSLFLYAGFLHWFAHLNPAIYFGQLDPLGRITFSSMGAFAKVLIIPFLFGLAVLFRTKEKVKLILGFLLILTYPAFFIHPNLTLELIVLTLPFMALILAGGFMQFNKGVSLLIIFLMLFELLINFSKNTYEAKITNDIRPSWVKNVVLDVFNSSNSFKTAVSDDIVFDIASFIGWYTSIKVSVDSPAIPYPYKYRQYDLENIKIIGSDKSFYRCDKEGVTNFYLSKRDLDKVQKISKESIVKIYQDNLDQKRVYVLQDSICI